MGIDCTEKNTEQTTAALEIAADGSHGRFSYNIVKWTPKRPPSSLGRGFPPTDKSPRRTTLYIILDKYIPELRPREGFRRTTLVHCARALGFAM